MKEVRDIVKSCLILIAIVVSLIYIRPSRSEPMSDSERAAYQWIITHPQPIQVHTIGDHNYLLIDSKGETFITGVVTFGTINSKK
jgi:hypothetical protein